MDSHSSSSAINILYQCNILSSSSSSSFSFHSSCYHPSTLTAARPEKGIRVERRHVAILLLFELLQEVGRLEVLGHGVIESGDDLVDRLLPRLFRVLARRYGLVELAQRLLNDVPEVLRDLEWGTGAREREKTIRLVVIW